MIKDVRIGVRVKLGIHRTIYWLICHYNAYRNDKSAASSIVYALYARSRLVGHTYSPISLYRQRYHDIELELPQDIAR